MKDKGRYICIKVDESLHKKLRLVLADQGSTIQKILHKLIEEFVKNKTT